MFETVDLSARLSKEEYKSALEGLEFVLPTLQRALYEEHVPALIVFEGWYASGRGDAMGQLAHQLDPRGMRVHVTHASSDEDRMRPWLYRFWKRLPPHGTIGIFDRSWYYLLWNRRFDGLISPAEWERRLAEVDDFERQLVDEGTILIKLWMHISQKEQKRRMKDWAKDDTQRWRVSDEDWKRHEHYPQRLVLAEEMLARTHTHRGPWTIIESEDERHRRLRVLRTVADTLRRELARRGVARERLEPLSEELPPGTHLEPIAAADTIPDPLALSPDSLLTRVDHALTIDTESYRERLKAAQKRLRSLAFESYKHRLPVVIVFEGWDAAGKGGAIKRMTAKLDPRGYQVIPIAAPTPQEKANHYLWRFWTQVPKDGHWAIFDRSWYGRVLVERVEGFATEDEWRRAYEEINAFEHSLHEHGTVIVKFWLDITAQEQLERFRRREQSPIRRHKITAEDWRNRARWPLYYEAVSDMLRQTSTAHAPWTIVEAQDKRWSRVKVCEHLVRAVESGLRAFRGAETTPKG
ncbi:MAG: polyphosphate:AMP phosphotransferase [Acidobacteria bacterium]|nr:polyphosphate:AMP phosphotransferase [Acidobacteriota bacterium]